MKKVILILLGIFLFFTLIAVGLGIFVIYKFKQYDSFEEAVGVLSEKYLDPYYVEELSEEEKAIFNTYVEIGKQNREDIKNDRIIKITSQDFFDGYDGYVVATINENEMKNIVVTYKGVDYNATHQEDGSIKVEGLTNEDDIYNVEEILGYYAVALTDILVKEFDITNLYLKYAIEQEEVISERYVQDNNDGTLTIVTNSPTLFDVSLTVDKETYSMKNGHFSYNQDVTAMNKIDFEFIENPVKNSSSELID